MIQHDKLTPMQAMTLTTASILSTDILRIQQTIVTIAGQDAWVSIALGGLLALAAGLMAYILVTQYPDMDFPEIHLEIAGKFFGRIILLITSVYMLLYIGLSLRIFAQALKMFLLDRTPMQTLVIFMALVAGYAAYKGLYTIGGVIDIIFPFIIAAILMIILLSVPQSSFINLKPVMFDNTKGILKAVVPSFQHFSGFGTILYFYSHTSQTNSRSIFFWYIAGILIPILFSIGLTIVSIAVFGPKDVITLVYPTLTLLKAIEFPATFLERLESFAVVLWIGIVFVSVAVFYYASTRNLMVLFGIRDQYQKYAVWGQIPVFFIIAMFEESGIMVFEHMINTKLVQTFRDIIIIPILVIAAFIKKRRGAVQ